jgi:hypothetical protein
VRRFSKRRRQLDRRVRERAYPVRASCARGGCSLIGNNAALPHQFVGHSRRRVPVAVLVPHRMCVYAPRLLEPISAALQTRAAAVQLISRWKVWCAARPASPAQLRLPSPGTHAWFRWKTRCETVLPDVLCGLYEVKRTAWPLASAAGGRRAGW